MRSAVAVVLTLAMLLSTGVVVAVGFAPGLVGLDGGAEGDPNVTVGTFEPTVAVNDGSLADATPSDGAVGCLQRGPPPGHVGLSGRLVLDRPLVEQSGNLTFRRVVTVADGAVRAADAVSLRPGDSDRALLFTIVEHDGTLATGETVLVSVTVRHANETVASATRQVTIWGAGRTNCEEL